MAVALTAGGWLALNLTRHTSLCYRTTMARIHTGVRVPADELWADRGSIAGVLGFSSGAKFRTGLRLTSSLPVGVGNFPAVTGPPVFPAIMEEVPIIIGGIIG